MLIGVGKSDVTGEVCGNHLMGYARVDQIGSGLLNRLYCRVFLLEKYLLIHLDIHSIPVKLRQEVSLEVSTKYGISAENILLHAQHTHSGPAGYHPSFLYSLTSLGYIPQSLHFLKTRILLAIDEAFEEANQFYGRVFVSSHNLFRTGRNRSPEAFYNNPEVEVEEFLRSYQEEKNSKMTVIRIEDLGSNVTRGVLTFFPVHTTSFTGDNILVNSDNKGYAEYLLETKFKSQNLLAAFFQSDAGDVSPNMVNTSPEVYKHTTFKGEGRDFVESCEIVGARQAKIVEDLLNNKQDLKEIELNVSNSRGYLNFHNYSSDGCRPQIGVSMLAGTEDGRGIGLIEEGWNITIVDSNFFAKLVSSLASIITGRIMKYSPHLRGEDSLYSLDSASNLAKLESEKNCQYPKISLVDSNLNLIPEILPTQILQLDSLILIALPFEVTSMAGYRIRKFVHSKFSANVSVEVVGLSNGYASYMTTPEEFDLQHYEGAFTLFGREQLNIVLRQLDSLLSTKIVSGKKVNQDVDLFNHLRVSSYVYKPDVFKKPKPSQGFFSLRYMLPPLGSIYKEIGWNPSERFHVTSLISSLKAQYFCSYPGSAHEAVESFCSVEKFDASTGSFKTFLSDHDWSLRFLYTKKLGLFDLCTCEWIVESTLSLFDLEEAKYRMKFSGVSEESQVFHGFSSDILLYGIPKQNLMIKHYNVEDYEVRIPDGVVIMLSIVFLIIISLCLKTKR